jgi:hypothetical protein
MDFGSFNADHLGSVLSINRWYHMAMVVIPTSTTNRQHLGYINGALNVNETDTTTFSAYTGITVGNSTFAGLTYALNGNVRDVRIWTRQLDATEIVKEMNSVVPVRRQGLLLWSPFDDDKAYDRSGNGYIWTPTAGVLTQAGPRKSYNGRGMNYLR